MPNQRSVPKSLYLEVGKFKLKGTGIATGVPLNVELGTPSPGEYWFPERYFVHCEATSGTAFTSGTIKCYLLIGDDPAKGVDWTSGADFTKHGDDDIADNLSIGWAAPGEPIKFHWVGLLAGDSAFVQCFISRRVIVNVDVPSAITIERNTLSLELERGSG